MKHDELDEFAAKPIKYFSHDTNASDDIKCRRLIKRGGWAAYGRWWRLCEVLGRIDGHALKIANDDDLDIAADYLQFDSVSDMVEFFELLRNVGLIEPDAEFVYSKRMFSNAMQASARKRGAAKTNAKRWGEK